MNDCKTYSMKKKEVAVRVARLAILLRGLIEGGDLSAERKRTAVHALQTVVLALRDLAR